MDNLVTIYHGGSVERDRYGYVEFVEMQSVPVLFNDRPTFIEFVSRVREELHHHGLDDNIVVEGVIHLGAPPNILRRIIPIHCENQWDNFVKSAMKSQLQCLDVVVRPTFIDPTPILHHSPVRDIDIGLEPVIKVPDAQSGPNCASAPKEIHISQPIGDDIGPPPSQDIPVTQNPSSKYRIHLIHCFGMLWHHIQYVSLSL